MDHAVEPANLTEDISPSIPSQFTHTQGKQTHTDRDMHGISSERSSTTLQHNEIYKRYPKQVIAIAEPKTSEVRDCHMQSQ